MKKRASEKPREIIKLNNVAKYYGFGHSLVKAVDEMDISVRQGEFVAIMGPSGSGKCVTEETQLITDKGEIIEIKNLEYKKNQKILGFDKKSGKIKKAKINKFFKRKTNTILQIKTSSGKEINTTKEHPFFTINKNGFSEIKASDLNKNTFIATPRKLNINGKSQKLDTLNKLSSDKTLIIANSTNLVKSIFKKLKVSRKEICTKLNILPTTYDCWLRKNNISLYNLNKILNYYKKDISTLEKNIKHLTGNCSRNKIKIPFYTSEGLLELYGFLLGGGNIDKQGIKITNLDYDLRNRIKYLTKKIFETKTTETQKRINIDRSVIKSFFIEIFETPLIKKSWNMKIPDFVFKCNNKEIAGLIRGLFDCDGYVSKNKKELGITLASKKTINQLIPLFLRFGIHTRCRKKIKYAANTKEKTKREYWELSISGLENIKLFNEFIGFNSKHKQKRLSSHAKNIKSNTNIDIIPCGELIKKIKNESRIKLSRKEHKLLWGYETKRINPSSEKLQKIIQLFQNKGIKTKELEKLIKMEIFWDKIISIEKINKKTNVYDLNIPETSNFIANNLLIHNSTSMNLVGTLDVPTKGKVLLDGEDIGYLEESDLAQIRGRKIGFIFQQFNLIPNLTALENVMLPMMFLGIPEIERIKRAETLLKKIGLGERMDHYQNQLSGGEQQRVAISRALANDPEVILADEPTGNLDTKTGHIVLEFLNKLNDEGKTIVMITHDPDLALEHADIIFWIKDGKVEKVTKKSGKQWKKISKARRK